MIYIWSKIPNLWAILQKPRRELELLKRLVVGNARNICDLIGIRGVVHCICAFERIRYMRIYNWLSLFLHVGVVRETCDRSRSLAPAVQ